MSENKALTTQRVQQIHVTQQFPPAKFNVLSPEVGLIEAPNPLMPITVSIVTLSPDDAHKMWTGEGYAWAPSRAQLLQLANAAGVRWIRMLDGAIATGPLPSDDSLVFQHCATAEYVKANGQKVQIGPMHYTLDLRPGGSVEEQVRMNQTRRVQYQVSENKLPKELSAWRGKTDDPDFEEAVLDYVEAKVADEMTMKRRHGAALAESGAMNRVIRALFNLKPAYSQAELSKPWVVMTAQISFAEMLEHYDIGSVVKDAMAARVGEAMDALGFPTPTKQSPTQVVEIKPADLPAELEDDTIDGGFTVIEDGEPDPEPEVEDEQPDEEAEAGPPPETEAEAGPQAEKDDNRQLGRAEKTALGQRLDNFGYPSVARRNLIPLLFGEGVTWGNLTALQGNCLYAYCRQADRLLKQAEELKWEPAKLKEMKDAAKDLVRDAYGQGQVMKFAKDEEPDDDNANDDPTE